MTRFSCGYCMHTFEAEEMPRECPKCCTYGPFYYVFPLVIEDEELEPSGAGSKIIEVKMKFSEEDEKT